METMKIVRRAIHAGSWYSDNPTELASMLSEWLTKASDKLNARVKAIISPHAGYTYSGATAAYSFKQIDPEAYDRIFILGPCHRKYINGIGLPTCTIYETPLGNLNVDTHIISELAKNEHFYSVKRSDEEAEHSLEMQLPYLSHIFKKAPIKIIPLMVGSIERNKEIYFGKLLTPYFEDERTLFVISSDFCHWGPNFDYYYYEEECGEIHKSIEAVDKRGIELIEKQDSKGFKSYLEATDNTICGRHPIGVLLNILENSKLKTKTSFLHYTQSEKVKSKRHNSVSYASIVTIENEE